MGEEKTTEQMAEKLVNKAIAKEIAKRTIDIKRHEAAIMRLKKEIQKIKDGEIVPSLEEEDLSSCECEKSHSSGILKDKYPQYKPFNYYKRYN